MEGAVTLFEDEVCPVYKQMCESGESAVLLAFDDIGTALYELRQYVRQLQAVHHQEALRQVDAQESITLQFKDGKMAVIAASMYAQGDTSVMFCGENGRIHLENIFNPECLTIYNRSGEPVEKIERPEQLTGYEYEVRSCLNAIEFGMTECPEMMHKDSIFMLDLMDELRAQWGMKYPCEFFA